MLWCGADIIRPGEGRMAGPGAIARAGVEWPSCGPMAERGLDCTLHGHCQQRGVHQDPVPPMPVPFTTQAILDQMDAAEHALQCVTSTAQSQPPTEERSATLVFVHTPRRPHRSFQSHRNNFILHDTDVAAHQHCTYMVTDITTSIA